MNNLLANYGRILGVVREISTERQLPMQRRRPSLSDLEEISLSFCPIGIEKISSGI